MMELVAIIKSLVNKRGSDGGGSCKVYGRAITTNVTNVVVAGTGDGDLLGKREGVALTFLDAQNLIFSTLVFVAVVIFSRILLDPR